ncbi:MAG: TIGR00282 family metallophosphoesterase [Deltaproteobacteria bacterium]|jgi:metallophosphoesterase (TIGR00282 family)|nr:TIGR00282 family metallophosphoesterase [Deltaproteobacteria bacterium]
MTKILFLGDIFAKTGRHLVREFLPSLKAELGLDLAIANAENAAGGRGLTKSIAQDLFSYGLAALSGGNHTFQQKDFVQELDQDPRLIRPANWPAPCPGRGLTILDVGTVKIGFLNLMGRIFMNPNLIDCPFKAADQILAEAKAAGAKITILDFHAETTSEKKALAHYLDGRLSALVGTHTHVQTADAQILPKGLAYMTDAGMTGPHDSIIGMDKEAVLNFFLTARPHSFKPANSGGRLEGVVLEFDEDGRAVNISSIKRP